MVLYNKKEDCFSCSACESICPASAIQMLPDDEGFLYSVIDDIICTNCGLCKKICAFKNGYTTENNFQDSYMVVAYMHLSTCSMTNPPNLHQSAGGSRLRNNSKGKK
jgi:ferredoxin